MTGDRRVDPEIDLTVLLLVSLQEGMLGLHLFERREPQIRSILTHGVLELGNKAENSELDKIMEKNKPYLSKSS